MKPLLLSLVSISLLAQAPTPAPPAVPAPSLTADLRSDYWQARAEVAEALANCKQCQKANRKMEEAIDAMSAKCGTPNLVFNSSGQPDCPAPPPK